MLRGLYILIMTICIVPIAPGIVGVILSSLGYIPAIGLSQVSLNGYLAVFQWSGSAQSLGLTVFSTLTSSLLTCLITFAILQNSWQSTAWKKIENLLSPLLAMPHVAFAIGFAFLFSPTGMLARLIEPLAQWLPFISDPSSQSWLIKNAYALGLTLVLVIKEVPFLLLMSIPIIQQLNIDQTHKVASSLGYTPAQMWWKCVLPQWLTKIRFPMMAIIAYSASVVDVGLIVGPTNPPTFAVLVWQWFSDPDLSLLPRAGAGAMLLFALTLVLIGFARLVEHLVTSYSRHWQVSGRSGVSFPGLSLFIGLASISIMTLPLMLLWSFAQRWRFPDLFPTQLSTRFWMTEWQNVVPTIVDSTLIAILAATIALFFAIICHEYREKNRWHVPGIVIAIPMLVPQLSILFGIQITTLYFSGDAYFFWVTWSHIFFAFPFVFLALDGPWRSYDPRISQAALSLGKTPLHVWLKIKAPILFPAIMFAWAVGMSVSLAQYLPTLMLGAGRISTLTTEAVALASGYDRRVTAIYAMWQAFLPFIFFSFAVLVSRLHLAKTRSHHQQPQIVRKPLKHESMHKKPRHI
ncbi:ABC transporter permease [Vibrio genomosp. F6]|uniref:Thiamine ABC transporter permease n=1 Tax=Vibrio genomosp. F6 str. FF-238 TaxID=1191298 RepID=A0A1E5D624_9VIBR|nr:thiamine ABC transporter permease [Vibrio genomosp. F6]OEE79076.1 thiamine ABC transporter permease [Vibrio genomosp. F6 str. FF-238]